MAEEPTNTEPVSTEPVGSEPEPQPTTPVEEPKFNKAQLQQISSIMGNLIKKSIDEQVIPLVSKREPLPTDTSLPDNPAVKQFNERLAEKIYSGDIIGALTEFQKVQERANQNLSKQQQTDLNKAISGLEERPHYKDVHSDLEKMANDLVKKGYPAGPAAELAYQTSVNNFVMGNAGDNSGSLSMISGGRRTITKPDGKLPPQFEKAYQQGKDKGLFTDRKDYVNSLDPRVVAQYGISV